MKKILVTGPPGCGKSTLINKVINVARGKNMRVGGILTPEIREGGVRRGFLIVDLLTGESKLMATVGAGSPRVGKYVVYTDVISDLGVRALMHAVESADIIFIDEIGKMELMADGFAEAVREVVNSKKPFLGTIGMKVEHPLAREIKSRDDVELILLSHENWKEKYEYVLKNLKIWK